MDQIDRRIAACPATRASDWASCVQHVERANRLYHEQDAPEISRRRVRPPLPRARGARGRPSGARSRPTRPRSAWARPSASPLARRRAPLADAVAGNAFNADELRAFDARVRRGLGLAADDAGPELRRRAEDRRAGHQPPLRGGPLRAGRDARRRSHRRGRHARTCARSRRSRSGCPSRVTSRCAARSTCPRRSSRASTPSARSRACRSTRTRATAVRARCARSTRA